MEDRMPTKAEIDNFLIKTDRMQTNIQTIAKKYREIVEKNNNSLKRKEQALKENIKTMRGLKKLVIIFLAIQITLFVISWL